MSNIEKQTPAVKCWDFVHVRMPVFSPFNLFRGETTANSQPDALLNLRDATSKETGSLRFQADFS
jgi:hypothetical protein